MKSLRGIVTPARLGAAVVGMAIVAVSPLTTLAAGPYPSGETGFDVSYPQAGNVPSSGAFGIVGVTGGRAFSQNQYFATEYDKAATATKGQVSLYVNLNAAIGSTSSKGLHGPKGDCRRGDKMCIAYNYGWNAAQDAVNYAGPRNASTWWLDIETANSWNANDSLNRQTIQGAVDGLKSRSITNVGIYSTPGMWASITGSWLNGLPVWFAGTSQTTCAEATGFTGGALWLVQNASGVAGGDVGC